MNLKGFGKMGLKVNVHESKLLVLRKDQRTIGERVQVVGKEMEEEDKFKHLRLGISGWSGIH